MSSRKDQTRSGPDPIANDRRRASKKAKLPPDAACAFCGLANPEELIAVKATVLEGHHCSGKTNDPELIVGLCLNHHAAVTARQLDAGIDLLHRRRTLLGGLAGAMRNQAVFNRALAEAQEDAAAKLAAFEARLDHDCPWWRELPEAWR